MKILDKVNILEYKGTTTISAAVLMVTLGLSTVSTSVIADGWFEIKPMHSGKCFGIGAGKKGNGEKVIQWACDGSDNQLWAWEDNRLKNKNSGRCLDVTEKSKDEGTQLQQWDCTGGENQFFKYTNDKQLNPVHTGKCVGIAGASSEDGAKVIQWRCDGTDNQQFDLAS